MFISHVFLFLFELDRPANSAKKHLGNPWYWQHIYHTRHQHSVDSRLTWWLLQTDSRNNDFPRPFHKSEQTQYQKGLNLKTINGIHAEGKTSRVIQNNLNTHLKQSHQNCTQIGKHFFMKNLFESEVGDRQLFFVTSYSDFEKLGKFEIGSWHISSNSNKNLSFVSQLLLYSFWIDLFHTWFYSPRPSRHRSQEVSLCISLPSVGWLPRALEYSGRFGVSNQSSIFSPPPLPERRLHLYRRLSRERTNHCI